MKTSPCKGCGLPIAFITSKDAKAIPIDPELLDYWLSDVRPTQVAFTRRVVLVQKDGVVARGWLASPTSPHATRAQGFVSHFATCSRAGEFRTPPRTHA